MYVIYINDRPLVLRGTAAEPCAPGVENPRHLTVRYGGKRKTLLHYADTLEKGSPKVTSVELVAEDPEALWSDFRSHYRWVPAAGGLVESDLGTLFIFRRGSWDLPKGKIDAGEDAPTAALREVEEETGVGELTLGEALPTTLHTYRTRKGNRILKPTYWFRMRSPNHALTPEVEEDIERAEWRSVAEILAGQEPLYASLRWLLTRAG